jgi:RNA polymerase sigma-70 factor, ECF subfamily
MSTARFQILKRENQPSSSSLPDERALVVQAQQGDTAAFKQLYEHHKDRVYNIIIYSLKERHSAEDVLQTVFVKAYAALPYFRQESNFLTWIYRVALNECKNRRRRKRIFVPLSESADAWNRSDVASLPDEQHAREQMQQKVREAVLTLRPKLRTVVVLRYVEDLSYEEIAAILGSTPGTVASRLHRALAALETKLRTSHPIETR